jgi:ADP-ribose pyrophosphatase
MKKREKTVKVVSSEVIYKSRWLTLRKDEIITQDGVPASYEIMERGDIVTVIAKEGASFYFIEQYRYPIGALSLELPQGFIDKGETPVQAAKRELHEEVGVTAEIMKYIGAVWVSAGYSTQQVHVFSAQGLGQSVQHLDATESDLRVKKYTREEMVALIREGKIKNSPTLSALTLYLFQETI